MRYFFFTLLCFGVAFLVLWLAIDTAAVAGAALPENNSISLQPLLTATTTATVVLPTQTPATVTATATVVLPTQSPLPTYTPFPTWSPAPTQTPWILVVTRIVTATPAPTMTPTATPTVDRRLVHYLPLVGRACRPEWPERC